MSLNGDRDSTRKGFKGDRDSTDNLDANQSQSQDDWLSLEIYVKADRAEFLTGLDRWLELNLISQEQVKKLCRNHLSCALPEEQAKPAQAVSSIQLSEPETEIGVTLEPAIPHVFTRIFQGFLSELSIRWLLFLGIFLVVVSSGVLAASQWQNFPAFGQYLVLLAYTLGFWLGGWWTGKQDGLSLTSQTLSAIATLLIPIDFWAISHLGLGRNFLEWGIVAVAAIVLTTTAYLSSGLRKTERKPFDLPLYLILGYLHLGWQVPLLPLVVVYGGIIVISLLNYLFVPLKKFRVNLLFLLAGWSLLLLRGLNTTAYSISDYCLAIAIFAWLIATIGLTQANRNNIAETQLEEESAGEITNAFLSKIAQVISVILFIFTWLLTVIGGITESALFWWQAVAISGLAIQLFAQRLTLYWRKRDLTAIFLIGLQTLYISQELIPNSWRSAALNLSLDLSNSEYFPESVFGVTLFPYVILFIGVASWLYRRQKLELALYGEYLTLLLGIVLTCLSLSNPTVRSLNLLLSTLTLAYVTQIRQRTSLIYLTHLLGLVTVVNGIDFFLPSLTQPVWGSILTILMAVEWSIYLRQIKSRRFILTQFRQSSWYFGLFLSAASYSCFLAYIEASSFSPTSFFWGLTWLVTPVMLTLVAKYTSWIKQRRLATILSCIALIMAQLLLLGKPEARFIGLAVAVCLMFPNAFHLRRTIVTLTHLGFALSLIASIAFSFVGNELTSIWYWLLIGGACIGCLYQLRLYSLKIINVPKYGYISQRTAHGILGVGVETRNFKLVSKYIQAADYWAIALIVVELAIISVIYPFLTAREQPVYYLLTIALLAIVIFWRYRLQPNNLILSTLTWLGSLFATASAAIFVRDGFIFAIINIILGLVSLLVVVRLTKADSPWKSLNLSSVPLVYATLGILWRLSDFNTYTGLLTLGAAIILLNTHQRQQVNAITNYLGLAGISLGIYELVIYQMQLSSGGSAADALTILSLVAASIAFTYRFSAWWCRQKKSALFNLSLSQVILTAHIHWAIGSMFKIVAAGIAIETATPRLIVISIATSLCLGAYAVIQGKDRPRVTAQANDWWVYVGLVEIAATLVYSRSIVNKLSLFDPWRVIFTCAIAFLIYQIPWNNFGWRATPWQRTALVIPALMTLVTAEDISNLSLLVTALFYLRIAYGQNNIRWSYISLGLVNWGVIRFVWQYYPESIWVAGIISLSVLYVAQFDSYFQSHYAQRHQLRLFGSSILCIVALFYQPGIIPSAIAFCLIFLGLGLKIRAFLFAGTVTLILTAIYQLVILVLTYSFLKWIVGLLGGICFIAIAAGFEKQRDRAVSQLKSYRDLLQDWQ